MEELHVKYSGNTKAAYQTISATQRVLIVIWQYIIVKNCQLTLTISFICWKGFWHCSWVITVTLRYGPLQGPTLNFFCLGLFFALWEKKLVWFFCRFSLVTFCDLSKIWDEKKKMFPLCCVVLRTICKGKCFHSTAFLNPRG